VKKKVAESAQDYNRKGILFQPHNTRAILCNIQQPQQSSVAQACSASGEMTVITKNCIKTPEAKWLLELTGSKYDCPGEGQQ
jgi:hypothetical protein